MPDGALNGTCSRLQVPRLTRFRRRGWASNERELETHSRRGGGGQAAFDGELWVVAVILRRWRLIENPGLEKC